MVSLFQQASLTEAAKSPLVDADISTAGKGPQTTLIHTYLALLAMNISVLLLVLLSPVILVLTPILYCTTNGWKKA